MPITEFVARRLKEEAEHFEKMLASPEGGYIDEPDRRYWQGLSMTDVEALADNDESMFGVEGFMGRFELYRRGTR